MAKLPPEITENLWNLKRKALEIVEEAAATEYLLFDTFGETESTLSYLGEMKNVAESATLSYSRLSNLHLQMIRSQLIASTDMLKLLYATIDTTSAALPALQRSIQEVKQEWSLP